MDVPKDQAVLDLCIIGGGINGAGIARDAAGRGLSVALIEKDDLAQGTSSRSGKLIHGGLRYLEYHEYRLVREALIEREVLLESAPHIIWPMRFVLPHSPQDRPAWLIRAGLFLYDHLGGRRHLPGSNSLNLQNTAKGKPIQPQYKRAFEYSDCWVDDARLVLLNALDAAERGAQVLTRWQVAAAERSEGYWRVSLISSRDGSSATVRARALINAAGPWVDALLKNIPGVSSSRQIRLVKGSHIVVKKFWQGSQAYLLQHTDKRVIFVNPYLDDLALIGTTDIPYSGDPDTVEIDSNEIDYLLSAVNRYTLQQLDRDDIISTFSGVRPLYDDNADNPSAVTRDYLFDINEADGNTPLLSVYGGKITTYRKLAEQAIEKIRPWFAELPGNWTASAHLPGGDIKDADFQSYLAGLIKRYSYLDATLLTHYARLYGTRAELLLASVQHMEDLGLRFSSLLYEAEVNYLINHEWAETAEDILQRRTKHGLQISSSEYQAFSTWLAQNSSIKTQRPE